jgi:hypothetical protein
VRIKAIAATDVLPVRSFAVDSLSDVVVIAGQNGVGKSRLIDGLIARFQSPHFQSDGPVRLVVEATCDRERAAWGQPILDTNVAIELQKLASTLQASKSRTKWESSVIHFESDRSISQIQPYQFNWDAIDPWGEALGWNTTFGGLKARFQDTLHSLFRKVQSNDKQIATRAKELQASGVRSMDLDFKDPLLQFKDAFAQLVGPKTLVELNPRDQLLYFEHEGRRLPVSAMSSGEREVVNIVFDFILRAPSDCIVFFDEPELHLHPELSYRLLQTLKSFGSNNQFFFCTHSPDIITASLENTVIFIRPPQVTADGGHINQAVVVTEDDTTNSALRLLGQSIGIVSLGKKIVLIEGTASSLDKQTYGFILKNRFPGLVLVPSGGRQLVESFQHVMDKVLSQTIWGVDFFMVCDRDVTDLASVAAKEQAAGGKLRYLKRYHLENYFLDPTALALVFADIEPDSSWLRSAVAIRDRLRSIARSSIAYAVGLIVSEAARREVGNVSIMPRGLDAQDCDALVPLFIERAAHEASRTGMVLSAGRVETLVRNTYRTLEVACSGTSDEWLVKMPGKPILSRFAAQTVLDVGRLKLAYIKTVQKHSLDCFEDIVDIFRGFAAHQY